MRLQWWFWRFLIRRMALSQGFLDPAVVLARLRRFAQPAEVVAPTELLRAGVVLHTRGLMNSQAIQHNLDWIWPYWVVRQFAPKDEAFIPWAFSITHINLTHRNWTAVGLPDESEFPLIDPRGLVTPMFDGWSLDAWIITEDGRRLFPSHRPTVEQRLDIAHGLSVVTQATLGSLSIQSRVEVVRRPEGPTCQLIVSGSADGTGWLIIALRPYNPEGVSFIQHIEQLTDRPGWKVNRQHEVLFSAVPERNVYSEYRRGDVSNYLPDGGEISKVSCDVGMATGAALFAVRANEPKEIVISVPLKTKSREVRSVRSNRSVEATGASAPVSSSALLAPAADGWEESLKHRCRLKIPDAHWQFLYEAALRTLVLHSPGDVYPGPYTYKRFWFRDAAFIIHALLCAGLQSRAERALDRFPSRQTPFGYCLSQDGEWDSNGEALWIMERFCALTGRTAKPEWQKPIVRAAHWIQRKRLSEQPESPHAGLLPVGFSAEHLGPNDYYYWDDFWGVAGLRSAAALASTFGEQRTAESCQREADAFMRCIERSLALCAERLGRAAMPAAPYRRLDAGAIGSVTVGYPLQLWAPDDRRLLETVNFLMTRCFVDGGFFQEMSHSGINPYLTLHVAQVLLRSGDWRGALDMMQAVANMASSTGQWPEAVHPKTRGGCMGDGQHVWAAAEWTLMLRNCFVREEGNRLILCSGIPPAWLAQHEPILFGSTLTLFGEISIQLLVEPGGIRIGWDAAWRGAAPTIEVRLPGKAAVIVPQGQSSIVLGQNS